MNKIVSSTIAFQEPDLIAKMIKKKKESDLLVVDHRDRTVVVEWLERKDKHEFDPKCHL